MEAAKKDKCHRTFCSLHSHIQYEYESSQLAIVRASGRSPTRTRILPQLSPTHPVRVRVRTYRGTDTSISIKY